MQKYLFLKSFEGKREMRHNKFKKARKILSWILGPILIATMVIAPIGVLCSLERLAELSMLTWTYAAMVFAPTFYVFTDIMVVNINDSETQIGYKQFRKMEKSGELDFYKMLYTDYTNQVKAGRKNLNFHPVFDDDFYAKYKNGEVKIEYDDQKMIKVKSPLISKMIEQKVENVVVKDNQATKSTEAVLFENTEDNGLSL